jgi:hypothetical protein
MPWGGEQRSEKVLGCLDDGALRVSPGNADGGVLAGVAGVEDPQVPRKLLCVALECTVRTGLPVRVSVQQHQQRALSERELPQEDALA